MRFVLLPILTGIDQVICGGRFGGIAAPQGH